MANPAPMDPTVEPAAGETGAGGALVLGRYRLGRRLGSGGFGTVFAARDERLDRIVAVKVIPGAPRGDGLDGPARDRAQREALAAARLDHPGIVSVFDAGEDGGARYLVSELVEGATLDRLDAAGTLSDRDVLRIGLTLAAALAHAHDRGVIHRDVKPQNVIVPDHSADGAAAKLTDFGVAHLAGDEPLTMTGDVVGTLAYMAPEQAAGERVDDRADLYALALVLHEALAGVNPVRAAGPAATARRVGTVLPPLARQRGDLPESLCAALDRALRPDPEERGELEDLEAALADALLDVSDEGGTIAPLPQERGPRPALPAWLARPAAAAAGGGLVALALAEAARAAPGAPPAWPAAAVAAAAVLLLPRLGWLAAAAAVVVVLARAEPALAALAALAAVLPPLLARRAGTAWSLPAAAPALGLAGLAGAYPALAGRARGARTRAALGAAGAAWALLAGPVLHRALVLPTAAPPHGWHASAGRALRDAAWPLAGSGAALLAVLWAAGALVLPWLVRGRSLAADAVAAAAWAGALAAGTAALAGTVAHPPAAAPGLAAGAVAAAVLAVLLPRVRRAHGIL